MEEQKEFKIISREEFKEMYEKEKLLSIGASIFAILGICSMVSSGTMLNSNNPNLFLGISLGILSTYLTIESGIHAKEEIDKVKNLKKYYEESANEDKVEIPIKLYKNLKNN